MVEGALVAFPDDHEELLDLLRRRCVVAIHLRITLRAARDDVRSASRLTPWPAVSDVR
jgi:hypothetical protein